MTGSRKKTLVDAGWTDSELYSEPDRKAFKESKRERGYRMQKQNMQVVLLEKSGFRYSLWLPVEREGRYEFSKNEHGVAPDVCIVGDGERWTVVDSQKEEIIYGVLESGVDSEINISRHNEKYTLYVEDSSDGNKLFLPYTFEKNCEIVLGRHDTCDLVYGRTCQRRPQTSGLHT